MEYVDADTSPVRVWYATPLGTSERALAVPLADEIDASHMWDKEKAAMLGHEPCADNSLTHSGGSSRLDIYIVYPVTGLDFGGRDGNLQRTDPQTAEVSTANGVTTLDGPGDNNCNGASHVIVNGGLDFEHLKSTTAHELFHAFQFSFRNSELPDHNWWSEASATWAKDLVYPKQNFEQEYLANYRSAVAGPEGPLDNNMGQAAYGAYIWAFYLDQVSGDPTGTAIGTLWKASETVAPIKAMTALPGWLDRFKEFALWNWKYKSGTKVEDWTGLGDRSICVNRDDLQQVDLVVSNSKAVPGADDVEGDITIEGLATGCSTGHYSIDVTNVGAGHHEGPGHHEGDGLVECGVGGGVWAVGGVYFPNDPDAPNRDIAAFDIVTTPGHEWVQMTVTHPTTDAPYTWSVMPVFRGTFSFTTNNAVRPWTIKAVADDPSQHIVINATCSLMEGG